MVAETGRFRPPRFHDFVCNFGTLGDGCLLGDDLRTNPGEFGNNWGNARKGGEFAANWGNARKGGEFAANWGNARKGGEFAANWGNARKGGEFAANWGNARKGGEFAANYLPGGVKNRVFGSKIGFLGQKSGFWSKTEFLGSPPIISGSKIVF
jgi:hypothetical protein